VITGLSGTLRADSVFTMGSTNRLSASEERLYEFFTR